MTWYSTCLYLTYLSQHNPLKVHPCCHKWKNLFSLLNNVPIRICSTLIYSSINEHLCSLHILSIMNNAPVNIIMYIFPLKSSFYFPKVLIYTQNGNSGSYAAAAKSLQSCPTLCDPTDCSPPGSSVHGIFQARVLEWGAIAFSAGSYSRPIFCVLRTFPIMFYCGWTNLHSHQQCINILFSEKKILL